MIDVACAGDSNYLAATNVSLSVNFVSTYAVSSSSPSLDIEISNTKQASANITIASGNGAKVDPSPLLLACQSITISRVKCTLASPILYASGAATSSLTVATTNPENVETSAAQSERPAPAKGARVFSIADLLLF